MKLTDEIKKYIDKSVLCWLATSSSDNLPNVSPKEAFSHYNDTVIIANITSPQTLKNIRQNKNVSISFIDIFVQKGFQLKGTAEIIEKSSNDFDEMNTILRKMIGDKFPFSSITKITVNQAKPIIAPSYILYPETTEADQIEVSKRTYRL
ncbi:MAG TPA: pyridoxamine 5'-phosphate oxidase family protein [Saprospiraceae bacterium]|nr:pyridoxamine 5'-phosphate oxidase family protein [Saprospiraceae bacterium]